MSAAATSGRGRRSCASLLLVLGAGAALAGCAASAAGPGPQGGSSAGAARAHEQRRAGLVVSHASSRVVQPQPRTGSCRARGSGLFSLPDRHCTPGALSPAVTQASIGRTICRSGYTTTVRPAESITEREKRASLAAYGDHGSLHDYEYDHLVSLELGGAPNDPGNLWPEPGSSPNPKDTLENRLHERVCNGTMTLAAAQRAIAGDWVAAYHAG